MARLARWACAALFLALTMGSRCSLGELSTPTPLPIPTVTPLALATLAPLPSPTVVAFTPTATPTATTVHVVKSGDTLATLAEQYGTSVDAIMRANNLTDPHMIKVGQELTIPRPTATPTPTPR